MRVTDAVVHISEAGEPDQPAFTLERLEKAMSEGEVDRVVIVPPKWGSKTGKPRDTIAVNEYAFEAARSQPRRFAVMARIDPRRPDAPAMLAEWMTRPGMKGLRLNVKWEGLETMGWIWPEALRREMPLYVLASEGRWRSLLPVIESNPGLRLILDHAARPAAGPDPWADLEQFLALARYDNLVVKLSGFPRRSKEPYPFRDIHGHIRRLYDAFGPRRLAWGSDYSEDAGRITYRQAVDLFREACDFLTASDREWILDKTLSRVLNWEE